MYHDAKPYTVDFEQGSAAFPSVASEILGVSVWGASQRKECQGHMSNVKILK